MNDTRKTPTDWESYLYTHPSGNEEMIQELKDHFDTWKPNRVILILSGLLKDYCKDHLSEGPHVWDVVASTSELINLVAKIDLYRDNAGLSPNEPQ